MKTPIERIVLSQPVCGLERDQMVGRIVGLSWLHMPLLLFYLVME